MTATQNTVRWLTTLHHPEGRRSRQGQLAINGVTFDLTEATFADGTRSGWQLIRRDEQGFADGEFFIDTTFGPEAAHWTVKPCGRYTRLPSYDLAKAVHAALAWLLTQQRKEEKPSAFVAGLVEADKFFKANRAAGRLACVGA